MDSFRSKVLNARPASSGIGIGKVFILKNDKTTIQPEKIERSEIQKHLDKLNYARDLLLKDFTKLKESSNDPEVSGIIEAQVQTLKDPELNSRIEQKIQEDLYTVVYAIFSSFNEYIQLFKTAGADWVIDRSIDISSIRDQFIKAIENRREKISVHEGDIIFAEEISSTVMVRISDINIAGIVIQKAGLTSHAVILSQSLGIPCVIGAHWENISLKNKTDVIIDGSEGRVIINPSKEEFNKYRALQKIEEEKLREILKWSGEPSRSRCGSEFTIRANVEFLEELPRLTEYGAEGIGLLRTETILFETHEFDVNEQVEFYEKAVKSSAGYPVTIRLFDAGGDKLLDNFETEANPFLGWRGIRMLLDNNPLLKRQIEAVYRVSGKYKRKVKLLVPMISGLEEVLEVKKICREVEQELEEKSVEFDADMQFGVMIEVPATVLMAESIARHVDFFSIGTNDLIQYTLAADRGNDKISRLYESYHPSIWKLIKMTVDAAGKIGIPVAVCGEMASKPEAASCFIGMGIKELSMNFGAIPKVKSVLCTHSLSEMKHLSEKVLGAEKIEEIYEVLREWMPES